MTPIFTRIARLLDRVQRRFRVARPGSVLILVVALLVLLALLGTAFIATTREDRYSASQNAKNNQVDLLVDGVVNLAQAAITGDLNDAKGNYRPADSGATPPSGYDHADGPSFTTPTDPATTNTMPDDLWMSSRQPRTQETQGIPPATAYAPFLAYDGVDNVAMWDAVGYPLIKNGATANYPWQFDSPIPQNFSPYNPAAPFNLCAPFLPTAATPITSFTGKPWFSPVTVPLTVNGVTTYYPGFQAYAITGGGNPAPYPAANTAFIAADADGDGVADSGLWKLPVGRIDGVTYYAAVRIIDNNSAVNVNTAWTNREYNPTTPYAAVVTPKFPRYLTPSSVGLAELLPSFGASASAYAQGSEMNALDTYRRRNLNPGQPVDDTLPNGTAHPEYAFYGASEYFYTQLGARLGNPGHVTVGLGNTFQPLTISDTTALAYHSCFINPDASPSVLEQLFYTAAGAPNTDALYRLAPNAPASASPRKTNYSASLQGPDIDAWYLQNHNIENETTAPGPTWRPRRDMFVASNPVSNQAPVHPLDTTAGSTASAYALNAGILPYYPVGGTAVSPPRVSINQAPFADLWRAYWNVMAEPSILPIAPTNPTVYGSPFDLRVWYAAANDPAHYRIPATPAIDPPTVNSPYIGRTFADYVEAAPATSFLPNPNNLQPFNPLNPVTNIGAAFAYTDTNPARMFSSSIRAIPDPLVLPADPQQWQRGYNAITPRFSAQQQMLLRAAIAAVNAEDLRDSDADVTAKRIVLQASRQTAAAPLAGQLVPVDAVVYGTERQPFITEIYADTETDAASVGGGPNPSGYVAIELYNPYPQDILLTNWKLVAIDRRSAAAAGQPLPPYHNNAVVHGTTPVTCNFTNNLPLDETTLIADFDTDPTLHVGGQDVYLLPPATFTAGQPPLCVPAGGYLLLENYDPSGAAPAGVALHRPLAIGLQSDGPANAALFNAGNDTSTDATPNARLTAGPGGIPLPQVNVACIPGLSGQLDPQWNTAEWPIGADARRSVFNREFVILRPRRADGQYSTGAYPQIITPAGTYPPLGYDERPNTTTSAAGLAAGEVPYSHLRDYVPVDSFDFTGMRLPIGALAPMAPLGRDPALNGGVSVAWHYSRQNADTNGTIDWKFVYPGRYDADPGVSVVVGQPGDPRPRQQGTEYTNWGVNNDGNAAWNAGIGTPVTPITLGINRTTGALASNANLLASYPTTFRIPLGGLNTVVNAGTFAVTGTAIGPGPMFAAAAQQTFPFGGFPRNGDMLAVPFIGAYRLSYLTNPPNVAFAASSYGSLFTVAELNSVTADASLAEDTDVYDDPIVGDDATGGTSPSGTPEREQLGRFCPIRTLNSATGTGIPNGVPDVSDYTAAGYPNANYAFATKGPLTVNDFGYDPSYQTNPATNARLAGLDWEPFWRYRWAGKLFDYLDVWSPSEDYQPNYPMQREFEPAILSVAPVPQPMYYPGDHVSYYTTTGQHIIYEYRGAPGFYAKTNVNPQAPEFQIAQPSGAQLIATAVKNGNGPELAAFRGGTDAQLHSEDHIPIEGLININTASWRVLATLPLVVNPATGLPDDTNVAAYPGPNNSYRSLNQELAKAIVYWRDVDSNVDTTTPGTHPKRPHGPFRNLFELNRVVDLRPNAIFPLPGGFGYPAGTRAGFANGFGTVPLPNNAADPDDQLGDLAPAGNGPDGVRSDYKERYLQLTRISNLITTRSDSFTCYVLVQGWRDAETANANLVVQRRVGFTIDRSAYTPAHKVQIAPQLFINN